MNLSIWHYLGIIILILDILWIVFYYYYATVKVYNFREKEHYIYLGYLWIHKKSGEYCFRIPEEMIENSITTKYRIISQSMFHKLKKGEKVHINFAGKYETVAEIRAEITVKNYIATSHQL